MRMASMSPDRLAKYRAHAERTAKNYPQVDPSRTKLNYRIIGKVDWLEKALAEILDMRLENFEKVIAAMEKACRASELAARRVLGPSDPWRAGKSGPMREIILTAHHDFFAQDLGVFPETEAPSHPYPAGMNKTEAKFVELAKAWLIDNFGDDVIEAHVDRDELTLHIHAIVMPRAVVPITRTHPKTKVVKHYGTRRVLQPSIHPLIKNYEKAQDNVGAWFSQIGLVRGQKHKQKWRDAVAAGMEPPKKPFHKHPTVWHREQAADLNAKKKGLSEREAELEQRHAALAKREAELTRGEQALAAAKTVHEREKASFKTAVDATRKKVSRAEAVVAVAHGIDAAVLIPTGDGSLAIDETAAEKPAAKRITKVAANDPDALAAAQSLFARAFARMKAKAEKDAQARMEAAFRDSIAALNKTVTAVRDLGRMIPHALRGSFQGGLKALEEALAKAGKAVARDIIRQERDPGGTRRATPDRDRDIEK